MKKLFILIMLASVMVSCKKSSDSDPTCNADMAGVSGTHKITAVSYKLNSGATAVDYYNLLFTDACERDDLFVLNANGTFNYTDAGVVCVPTGNYAGSWNLTGSTFTFDGDVYTLQSFNCSTLVVVASGWTVPGDQLTITFTRQ